MNPHSEENQLLVQLVRRGFTPKFSCGVVRVLTVRVGEDDVSYIVHGPLVALCIDNDKVITKSSLSSSVSSDNFFQ